MSMNPRKAHRGSLVRFSHPDAGFPGDGELAKETGLIVGSLYTVQSVKVYGFSSDVILQGIEGQFNSCLFDDADAISVPSKD